MVRGLNIIRFEELVSRRLPFLSADVSLHICVYACRYTCSMYPSQTSLDTISALVCSAGVSYVSTCLYLYLSGA